MEQAAILKIDIDELANEIIESSFIKGQDKEAFMHELHKKKQKAGQTIAEEKRTGWALDKGLRALKNLQEAYIYIGFSRETEHYYKAGKVPKVTHPRTDEKGNLIFSGIDHEKFNGHMMQSEWTHPVLSDLYRIMIIQLCQIEMDKIATEEAPKFKGRLIWQRSNKDLSELIKALALTALQGMEETEIARVFEHIFIRADGKPLNLIDRHKVNINELQDKGKADLFTSHLREAVNDYLKNISEQKQSSRYFK